MKVAMADMGNLESVFEKAKHIGAGTPEPAESATAFEAGATLS